MCQLMLSTRKEVYWRDTCREGCSYKGAFKTIHVHTCLTGIGQHLRYLKFFWNLLQIWKYEHIKVWAILHVGFKTTLKFTGLKTFAIRSSGTSTLSFWRGNFSLLLTCWARDHASSLPNNSLNEQTKLSELLVRRASWNSSIFKWKVMYV